MNFGSSAAELAVCVRAVGLVDRSDLSKLVLEAPAAQLAALTSRLAGAAVSPGGVLSAGSAWWCGDGPGRVIVLSDPDTGSRLRERLHVDARRFAGMTVRDASAELAAIGLLGRSAGNVLAGARSVRRVRRSALGGAVRARSGRRDPDLVAAPLRSPGARARAARARRPGVAGDRGRRTAVRDQLRRARGCRPVRTARAHAPGCASSALSSRSPARGGADVASARRAARAGRVARARARDRRGRLRAALGCARAGGRRRPAARRDRLAAGDPRPRRRGARDELGVRPGDGRRGSRGRVDRAGDLERCGW